MKYVRMPIEIEAPEQMGYDKIKNNLTESSYTDTVFKNIDLNIQNLVLCYADHVGHLGLRKQLIEESKTLTADDVLITAGAASALFIVSTSLLEKGDELIVVRPNYATNIETPKAIGAKIHYIDLKFENGFQIDIAEVEKVLSSKTKYISVTHPHNPTGVCLNETTIKKLAQLAEKNNTYLLVDETYRDMAFENKLPIACDYSEKIISVSSLSKTYGLPGIRIGWLMCRDKKMMETFLAAKEQIYICGSILDEEVAHKYLTQKNNYFPAIKKDIQEKFAIVKNWMNSQDVFEWVEPKGGVVCFPRFKNPQSIDVEKFYQILNHEFSTYVGPGHWFEMPKTYMRVGFGWPDQKQLKDGLECLIKAAKLAKK